MKRLCAVVLFAAGSSCGDASEGDPCAGIACSGHGTCQKEDRVVSCDCDPGYSQHGLSCVEDPALACERMPDEDGDGHEIVPCGGDDCDGRDASVHPGAADTLGDGVDEDCDGTDGADADADGHASLVSGGDDCDDGSALVHPGADDRLGDGLDEDCDGADGVDGDGDDHASIASGGDDCDDDDPAAWPGALDLAGDAVDRNCDGVDGIDRDGDGWASIDSGGGDCDDADRTVHPGAVDDAIGDGWTTEVVASDGAVGWSPSLALDAGDEPWIAFGGSGCGGAGAARLAIRDASGWRMEEVDPGGGMGCSNALALDDAGAPHVVYSPYWSDLWYATPDAGGWATELVDPWPGAWNGATPAMALGADGAIHVAYFNDGELHYATGGAGAWTIETADTVVTNGQQVSLAIDAEGDVHLSYSDSEGLRYATNTSGLWQAELVDGPAGEVGSFSSLAVDDLGIVHVAYTTTLYDDLDEARYATRDAADDWSTETISGEGRFESPSLALGADGVAHVAMRRVVEPRSELVHATLAGGVWTLETVDDEGGQTGYGPSLRIGSDGMARITYYDDGAQDLRYAWNVRADGIDQDCDGIDGVDADGDGHTARETGGDDCDDRDASIHPGVSEDEEWTVTTVDEAPAAGLFVGSSPEIAADGDDVAVCYTKYSSEVVCARGSLGVLVPETVGGTWTWNTGMTMAGGTTHVVFGDTQGDLAHGSDDPFPFSIETVDERRGYSVRAGLEAEIAASADGALHVAYFVAPEVGPWPSAYELWYATNESGAWTTELLDTAGIPNAAITVDGDVVHVSYFDESNVDLRYARREAGVWTLETVEPGSGSFGANRTSIGASDGAVTIAYPEPADPSHVRLATKDGAVWTRRTLDVRGAFAMAMDGGATYVVAVERGGVALYTDLRGGFDREEVADDSEGASDLAIAIGEGDLHVAFQTGIGESLRYATRQKPDGVDRDCDGRD